MAATTERHDGVYVIRSAERAIHDVGRVTAVKAAADAVRVSAFEALGRRSREP